MLQHLAFMNYKNGKRVGEDRFAPGWTDYHKRIQYQTYDVTSMLTLGDNAFGAVLGDGWYAGQVAHVGQYHYGPHPLWLFLQMEIEYEDGSKEVLVSDDKWKGSTGPILFSDLGKPICKWN